MKSDEDSSSDEDYCPTNQEEKEFEKSKNAQKIEILTESKTGMTSSQSALADEILKSFKENKKISPEKAQKSEIVEICENVEKDENAMNSGISGNVTKTKEYDFAGETVTVTENIQKKR